MAVRPAKMGDIPSILKLIRGLAEYEKALDEVVATPHFSVKIPKSSLMLQRKMRPLSLLQCGISITRLGLENTACI
jgi:hypothetical protein